MENKYLGDNYNGVYRIKIENLGYVYINYIRNNANDKLIFKDNLGYYFIYTIRQLRRNNFTNLSPFDISNPYTINNIKLWCKLNNVNFEIISQIYQGSNKKLQAQCLNKNCGKIFEITWYHIQGYRSCPYCKNKKVCFDNCLATNYPEIAKEWHPTKNDNTISFDVVYGSNKKVWWQCSKNSKHIWRTAVRKRTVRGDGCPFCSQSKGEKEINKILNLNNIHNIPQKEFEGLVGLGGGLLSYDFYLPTYNLLIEYQGEQHKYFCEWFHESEEGFKKQQEHDRRKKEYAQNNNINLLEIWYWDFDNIEEILKKELDLD